MTLLSQDSVNLHLADFAYRHVGVKQGGIDHNVTLDPAIPPPRLAPHLVGVHIHDLTGGRGHCAGSKADGELHSAGLAGLAQPCEVQIQQFQRTAHGKFPAVDPPGHPVDEAL